MRVRRALGADALELDVAFDLTELDFDAIAERYLTWVRGLLRLEGFDDGACASIFASERPKHTPAVVEAL